MLLRYHQSVHIFMGGGGAAPVENSMHKAADKIELNNKSLNPAFRTTTIYAF